MFLDRKILIQRMPRFYITQLCIQMSEIGHKKDSEESLVDMEVLPKDIKP